MSPAQSDRNLLFGILAVQMDFIGRDTLVAGMHAWVLDKGKPLGQVLREQGALSEEHLGLLGALVEAHVRRHGEPEGIFPDGKSTCVGSDRESGMRKKGHHYVDI